MEFDTMSPIWLQIVNRIKGSIATGSLSPGEKMPGGRDLAVRYFHDQVVRLHNHASVIAWLTGSDRIPNPGLEERYLKIFEKEEYRSYVCSAKNMESLAGWSGTKMEGPYEYVGADYWYKDKEAGGAFGWNTETGIGANLPQLGIPEENDPGRVPVADFRCLGLPLHRFRFRHEQHARAAGGRER